MMRALPAALGGSPAFQVPVSHGDARLPDMSRLGEALCGIFARRYFANHGPLAGRLEQRVGEVFGMTAVAVVNAASAIALCTRALGMSGPVLCPPDAGRAVAEGLAWGGGVPSVADGGVTGVAGALRWSGAAELAAVIARARALAVPSLCLDEFGCCLGQRAPGSGPRPDALVLAFDGHGLSSGGGGACVLVPDERHARRLRTMRSFHTQETLAPVAMRMNGKMSEAQAALVLTALDEVPERLQAWRAGREIYGRALAGLEGLFLVLPPDGEVGEIGLRIEGGPMTPDGLWAALALENLVCGRPAMPGSAALVLPVPIAMTPAQVRTAAERIALVWRHREAIAKQAGPR